MRILCIDPGTTESGICIFDGETVEDPRSAIPNDELILYISKLIGVDYLAIEMVACYGMPVGVETFETCLWIGRFIQAFGAEYVFKIYRKDIKLCLCNSLRAKDANVRRAILDLFPATGGGKTPQIGTKKQPGPLYGVTSHAMSALAVGITFFEDTNNQQWKGKAK